MQLSTLLTLSTTLLTSALASPLSTRQTGQQFSITTFTAGCIPHGTLCTINFDLSTPNLSNPTTCSFSGQPLGSSSLPDTPFAACSDPSVAWSFRRVTPNEFGQAPFYELAVVTGTAAAAKFLAGSEFPLLNAGSSFYQSYTGPSAFVLQ
ncbi:hypothetical protein QBC44DRAFT_313908 [Cladorrhinum sp. PSN332]|nr:hypothetical protein QBC44DRAFT_313908 [Cladorrhinum sp. PSN332]